MARTNGISPKAILAAAIPALSTLVGVGIAWAVTGEVDRLELTMALTGVATSLLAGVAAWAGDPGDVVLPEIGPASDELLDLGEVEP